MRLKLIILSLTVFLILALVPIAFADNGEPDEPNAFCADRDGRRHPVGGRLADVYEVVDYQQIMGWFCDQHFGFGEILLALQTSQIPSVTYTPGDLLQMKTDLGGWGEVWKALGYNGRPKANRPAWAGPKDGEGEGTEDGPPAWAAPKDREEGTGEFGPPPWAGPKDKNKPFWKDKP
jgi:hypothetical protein